MYPRIKSVKHIADFQLQIEFTNGEEGMLDLRAQIVGRGGVFKQLQDVAFFAQVQVDTASGTLVWPNGVDVDPDVLYCRTMKLPLPQPALS